MKPIEVAWPLYGIKEVVGKEDNPIIIQMFNDLDFDGEALKDETPWCSLAMNWCHKVSGYPYTGSLSARSWLDLGDVVTEPQFGDVVVLWRGSPDSWQGHVGFWITDRGDGYVWILGGNQGNAWNISAYYKSRVLGYRRPILITSNNLIS